MYLKMEKLKKDIDHGNKGAEMPESVWAEKGMLTFMSGSAALNLVLSAPTPDSFTHHKDCVSVLAVRSPKSRCQQDHTPTATSQCRDPSFS